MQDQATIDRKPQESVAKDGAASRPVATVMSGAMAGAIGTWALDRADWFMWDHESEDARERTRSVRPNGEPPAHVLVSKAEKRLGTETSPGTHAALGQAVHFGIGIAPAIGYAFLRDKLPGRGIGRGLMFGAGLFLMQDEGLNSVSGLSAKPRDYPWQAHARGLVAHLIYGVVTELALNAMDRSARRLAHDARDQRGRADPVA